MTTPRALVLTAGLGTRLRPLTYIRAKAAVPVNGETLARRAVRWLASQGITDLVLNLHHHPATITSSVGDGSDLGARVRYSWEQPVLGSAGGPRHALPLLIPNSQSPASAAKRLRRGLAVARPDHTASEGGPIPNPQSPAIARPDYPASEGGRVPNPESPASAAKRLRRGRAVARPDFTASEGGRIPNPESRAPNPESRTFIIVNGDTLTDVDLAAMGRRHAESGALVTMAVIPNPRPDRYGGVLVGDSGHVLGFTRANAAQASYHFIGVQFADARAFAALDDGVPAESVNALYPRLIAAGPRSIAAFVCDASFQDIGTPADYLRTSVQLARAEGDRLAAGRNVRVAASAIVRGTAIWDDVVIGARATLVDCVVGDGACIPDDARYERCAIVPAGARRPAAGERIADGLLIVSLD
jgi:NDP-sugar pyrophosphorylase family protein